MFGKKKQTARDYDLATVEKARQRLKFIKNLAGQLYGRAPKGLRINQSYVVVSAEDLLKLWDQADRALWDL